MKKIVFATIGIIAMGFMTMPVAAQGTQKASAGTFTVALSTSKAVNILDENKIPARFLVEQAPKIDKSAIRAELMTGAEIEGCELQINEGVRIK